MSDVEKGTGEGRHFRFGITMSETSEKPETLPVAAAPGCSPEEGGRGEGGEEETSENGGGAVAVGALDATPPSALSPVTEEPTGDTKKKSKSAGGGKITCQAGREWGRETGRRRYRSLFSRSQFPVDCSPLLCDSQSLHESAPPSPDLGLLIINSHFAYLGRKLIVELYWFLLNSFLAVVLSQFLF